MNTELNRMEKNETKYVINKSMIVDGQKKDVYLLDGSSEVLEFDDKDKADNMAETFNINSDSGWEYTVKTI